MNPKEKYNLIILEIEKEASNRFMKSDELMHKLVRSTGLSGRDFAAVINYMTNDSPLNYIKKRKLMAAYRHLISQNNLDIESAIAISGFENQSSFTKRFSSFFSFSPKEAFLKKDYSLLEEPLTWDVLSESSTIIKENKEDTDPMQDQMMYGMSKDHYKKVIQAYELEGLYGLSSMYGQLAFELSDSLNISLEKAFEYANEIHDFIGEYDSEEYADNMDKSSFKHNLESLANDPFSQFLFFTCGLSLDNLFSLPLRTSLNEKALMKLDPKLLRTYVQIEEIDFNYLKDAYDFYKANADDDYGEEDYEQYINLICIEVPKEEAFFSLTPLGDIDTYLDSKNHYTNCFPEEDEYDKYADFDYLERMDEENKRWNNEATFDIDYDDDYSYHEH